MARRTSVPFYSNLEDNTHCNQASFRMILKYFLPDRDFSWAEMEKMSAKLPGKATWPAMMLINLRNMGFDVVMIEGFDAQAFIQDGGDYLRQTFGTQTADWQIEHSDIAQEQRNYQQMLDAGVQYEHRIPTIDDIRDYLSKGYLVKVTVNSQRLNHKSGYIGHALVVYDVDDHNITFHDPGLPAREARVETIADFQAAWADPNDEAKAIIAVKYQ